MPHPSLTRSALPFQLFFDSSSILLAIGWLLIILGVCLCLPAALAALYHESTLHSFLISSFYALSLGVSLVLGLSGQQSRQLRLREGFLLTMGAWMTLSFFSCLPFYLSGMTQSLTDALFEAVSSLTTTGISVLEDAHYLPNGLRFWRIFLQWLGGFGIILMAVTLLPLLKIGGTQLMTTEFSDRSEKMMPRSSHIAAFLMGMYVCLTGISTFFLWMGHLSACDALYYSMSAISTGGIIVAEQPLNLLSPYCKSILMMTMALGGSTLIHLVSAVRGQGKKFFQDEQIRFYYRWLGISSCIVIYWIWETDPFPILNGCFMAISSITTTGYGFGTPYDGFLSMFFLIACMIGGCSGSTTGGLKIFRLQILWRITRVQLLSMLKPYGLFLTLYNHDVIEESAMISIITTAFFYVVGWLVIALGFSFWNHTLSECLTLSASLITNSGLTLSPLLNQASSLMDGEKWLAIIAMLCGRFEFITLVMVLLIPFWRR